MEISLIVWELTTLRLSSPLELLLGLTDVHVLIRRELSVHMVRLVYAFKNIHLQKLCF